MMIDRFASSYLRDLYHTIPLTAERPQPLGTRRGGYLKLLLRADAGQQPSRRPRIGCYFTLADCKLNSGRQSMVGQRLPSSDAEYIEILAYDIVIYNRFFAALL